MLVSKMKTSWRMNVQEVHYVAVDWAYRTDPIDHRFSDSEHSPTSRRGIQEHCTTKMSFLQSHMVQRFCTVHSPRCTKCKIQPLVNSVSVRPSHDTNNCAKPTMTIKQTFVGDKRQTVISIVKMLFLFVISFKRRWNLDPYNFYCTDKEWCKA